jgi:hypothetical protein
MTRSTQLTRAVSGQTKRRAGARDASPPASMRFLSFEDNGGAFHWAVVATSADRLVPSATFASYEEAKQAAGVVRSGAVSAPSATPDPRLTYNCPKCGHALRVSGLGRHRVSSELTDERADDPVMNRVAPACGHGLPGMNRP